MVKSRTQGSLSPSSWTEGYLPRRGKMSAFLNLPQLPVAKAKSWGDMQMGAGASFLCLAHTCGMGLHPWHGASRASGPDCLARLLRQSSVLREASLGNLRLLPTHSPTKHSARKQGHHLEGSTPLSPAPDRN